MIEATKFGAHGVANLGMAEYQDEYLKAGWKIASRTVIIAAEPQLETSFGEVERV